jgi:ubiquinone/menaquinone biosynthesis C-methylase UbiE/ribosome modulation factor
MERAIEIVQRAQQRESEGKNKIPKERKSKSITPEEKQETKDAQKLGNWKQALKGNGNAGKHKCPDKIRNYLDQHLPGWRDDLDEQAMQGAIEIVQRAELRESEGKNKIPQHKTKAITSEEKQEQTDARKLSNWKEALKLKGNGKKCSNEVRDYLDQHLPGWRDERDLDAKAMEIVQRAELRESEGKNKIPQHKTKAITSEEKQEQTDARKLSNWKEALKLKGIGKGRQKCSNEVRDYLDQHLPGWRDDLDEQAMQGAIEIVQRAELRENEGKNKIPQHKHKPITSEEKQEQTDARKLGHWKEALKGKGKRKCSDEVRGYLDQELPGWRDNKKQVKKTTKLPTIKNNSSSEIREPKSITREQQKSELSTLHQKYKTMRSTNLHTEFQQNPQLWHDYHALAQANDKHYSSDDIPRNRIREYLNKIQTKRCKTVMDLGCGYAELAHYFKCDPHFHFINVDHCINRNVKNTIEDTNNSMVFCECDIAEMPHSDHSAEIVILSMAMWGSNCRDYLSQAYRVLETAGQLFIIEPTRRWSTIENNQIVPETEGELLKQALIEAKFRIIESHVDRFALFVCTK